MSDQSDGVAAAHQAVLDGLDAFAATPAATLMQLALERAYASGSMTAIAGPPGSGKSTACKNFMQRSPAIWRCQFTRYTKSVHSVLGQIARGLGMGTISNRPGDLGAEVEYLLRQWGGMLICDEAQHLTADGFETVRGIFDGVNDAGTAFGVALVGHTDLMDKIGRLPQLMGRVAAPLRIAGTSPADVDAILDRCEVGDARVRAFLRDHAGQSTGLRRIVGALRGAVLYAAADGMALKEAHVRQAWGDLTGTIVK